jgi:hypothetical protein
MAVHTKDQLVPMTRDEFVESCRKVGVDHITRFFLHEGIGPYGYLPDSLYFYEPMVSRYSLSFNEEDDVIYNQMRSAFRKDRKGGYGEFDFEFFGSLYDKISWSGRSCLSNDSSLFPWVSGYDSNKLISTARSRAKLSECEGWDFGSTYEVAEAPDFGKRIGELYRQFLLSDESSRFDIDVSCLERLYSHTGKKADFAGIFSDVREKLVEDLKYGRVIPVPQRVKDQLLSDVRLLSSVPEKDLLSSNANASDVDITVVVNMRQPFFRDNRSYVDWYRQESDKVRAASMKSIVEVYYYPDSYRSVDDMVKGFCEGLPESLKSKGRLGLNVVNIGNTGAENLPEAVWRSFFDKLSLKGIQFGTVRVAGEATDECLLQLKQSRSCGSLMNATLFVAPSRSEINDYYFIGKNLVPEKIMDRYRKKLDSSLKPVVSRKSGIHF